MAILARGQQPKETRGGLPGDPEDLHSRYIETTIDGIASAVSISPTAIKAGAEIRWFERLTQYAKKLFPLDQRVVLAGDYNVIPTELDAYKPERWVKDALFPESSAGY